VKVWLEKGGGKGARGIPTMADWHRASDNFTIGPRTSEVYEACCLARQAECCLMESFQVTGCPTTQGNMTLYWLSREGLPLQSLAVRQASEKQQHQRQHVAHLGTLCCALGGCWKLWRWKLWGCLWTGVLQQMLLKCCTGGVHRYSLAVVTLCVTWLPTAWPLATIGWKHVAVTPCR
jgi:hypothetical protein